MYVASGHRCDKIGVNNLETVDWYAEKFGGLIYFVYFCTAKCGNSLFRELVP